VGTLSKRKGGRGGAEFDVEAALDELYGTPPSGFVARRGELMAAARTAGRAEDARRIAAARRPTLAAWTANLLLRSQPAESRRFLELGEALREAYRSLDAAEVGELSKQRRTIVAALSRQAAQLARESGHRLSDSVQQDVEATLRAVLADAQAAEEWARGRLVTALTPPSDFPGAIAATGRAEPEAPPAEAVPRSAPTRAKDEVAERRRRRQEQLEQAREAADEAARELRDKRAEQADADVVLQRARTRHDRAQQEVEAAERQLRQAREQLEPAERERQEAEERSRAAADALARAERAARETAREVKRLGARRT
jgi:hypothetical protein